MSDNFTGHWLVSEYVYNPDGTFAGIVHQRRMLEPQSNGRIRVIQQCEPDVELAQHPMGEFKGEWVFDLVVDGRARRYLGVDVVGEGLAWGKDVITGRGVWTRFGHNFTSFGVMVTPEYQITGGKFYNASEMIANIIGVAVPERKDVPNQWAAFSGVQTPSEIAAVWKGECDSFDPDGSLASIYRPFPVTRTYHDNGWMEEAIGQGTASQHTITLEPRGERFFVRQKIEAAEMVGIGKRSGWLFEMELHSPQEHGTTFEVLDSQREQLIVLDVGWFENNEFTGLGITRMKPEK